MNRDLLIPTFFSILIFAVFSCDQTRIQGHLHVKYIDQGRYEIYKIASETPLQFVSEQSGQFNKSEALAPGSYLILADCSSKVVNIYPGSRVDLTAHKVNFIPLQPPNDSDKFSIQCQRSEKTRSWQHLTNHYSLAILSGTRDLLVGMVPLQVTLESTDISESRLVSYLLSSMSVSQNKATQGSSDNFDFFVAPQSEMAPYTEMQSAGRRMYLLRGAYKIQLNGTETKIDLAEGEGRIIIPAQLRVEVNPNAPIDLATKIKGSPLYVEANGEHFLHLNTTYSVLPGTIKIRLSTMLRPIEVSVKEGEVLTLKTKNVIVDLGCNDNDWGCLGTRKVSLFEKDKSYPFAQSVTDVPILYFGNQPMVGIEGSRNIKYELSNLDDQRMHVGFLEILPTPSHKPGTLTDLVRVEGHGMHLSGSSLDLQLDKPTIMPLIVGQYSLSQYTYFSADGSRRRSSQSFVIHKGDRISLSISTFVTEKKLSQIEQESTNASPEKSKILQ